MSINTTIDPFYKALVLFKTNKIQECHKVCNSILEKNPLDQAAWSLKLGCFTEETYIDELENDEIGMVDIFMDDNIISKDARPGTSFNRPLTTASGTSSQVIRPRTTAGRPISGVVRPQTIARPGTMEKALRSSRTSKSSRPVSSSSVRQLRLGTASMIAQKEGPFVNLARLNIDKYASDNSVNKYLFEYVFYHEGDMKIAHQIAATATKVNEYEDWYWKNALGKVYFKLGMFKDSEKQFMSSLKNFKNVETFAFVAKVYTRLDQPNTAIDHLRYGLQIFRDDVTLQTHLARIYEQLGNIKQSITIYTDLLRLDASNIEAIACLGTHAYYNEQPEQALGYYRRILQMGVNNATLFMNLGLCCFASQQLDLAIACIEKSLYLATDDIQADIWYNVAYIAISNGDQISAARCYRLAIAHNPDHAESYNNLGVIFMKQQKYDKARHFFKTAITKNEFLYEPHFNLAFIYHETGELVQAYKYASSCLEIFPAYAYALQLKEKISEIIQTTNNSFH
uniref:Tetratricopeptide repeat protein 8 (inferred by orthology to a human protein) n=1 Tax=Strongyloides venezuelensis TaxID=75913 RepID=A0A0K0F3T8_STRVS